VTCRRPRGRRYDAPSVSQRPYTAIQADRLIVTRPVLFCRFARPRGPIPATATCSLCCLFVRLAQRLRHSRRRRARLSGNSAQTHANRGILLGTAIAEVVSMKHVTLRWLRTLAALAASVSLLAAGTVKASPCGGPDPMPCCKGPGLNSPMACCAAQAREARPSVAAVPADQKPIAVVHATSLPPHLEYAAAEVRVFSSCVFVPRAVPSTILRI
jgi:hypothetical protein